MKGYGSSGPILYLSGAKGKVRVESQRDSRFTGTYSSEGTASSPEPWLWQPDVVHISGKNQTTDSKINRCALLATDASPPATGTWGDFWHPSGSVKSGRINPCLAVFETAGPRRDPQRQRPRGCVHPGAAAGCLRWVPAGRVAQGTWGSLAAWHGRTMPVAVSD